MIRTMGKRCEIPLSLRRPLLSKKKKKKKKRMLGFSSLLCSNVPSTHRNTHTQSHTHTDFTGDAACRRGAPLPDSLCCSLFGISPFLQRQKVTLRSLSARLAASTRSRCTQQGGAPQHRRASGGWPSELLSMDDRNRLQGGE